MPRPLVKVALMLLGKALILLTFYSELASLANTVPIIISKGLSTLLSIAHQLNFLALIATSVLAFVAFVTGNAFIYATAVILSAFTCPKPCLPLAKLPFFIAYLALDSITTSYRGLEQRSIRVRFWALAKSVPIPLLVIILCTTSATIVTLAVAVLISSFAKVPQSNPRLYAVMTSPITKIVVSLAALLYAYSVAKDVSEITAVAIAPAPSAALAELLREEDIDIVFVPVFRWLLYIALAAVLYSPVYTMVFNILLPDLLNYLGELMKMGVSLLTYVLLIFLSRSFDILSGFYGSEKRLTATSLVLLALAYVSATKLAFPYTGWRAFLAPDFQGLGEAIQKSYVDFGNTILTLINALSRLVGAAP
jgi:hypothetical protein